jgi:putative PIN family toxin of toxin-antitoxin system
VLVSAAISQGPPYRLLIFWIRGGGFELVVSHRLLYELEAVLLREEFRSKLSFQEILEYVLWLHERGVLADEGDEIPRRSADPDDDYLIALALACEADLIVSGDRDLLELEGEDLPRIVRPAEFLSSLESRD